MESFPFIYTEIEKYRKLSIFFLTAMIYFYILSTETIT